MRQILDHLRKRNTRDPPTPRRKEVWPIVLSALSRDRWTLPCVLPYWVYRVARLTIRVFGHDAYYLVSMHMPKDIFEVPSKLTIPERTLPPTEDKSASPPQQNLRVISGTSKSKSV